jgi:hypothetical protein
MHKDALPDAELMLGKLRLSTGGNRITIHLLTSIQTSSPK